MTTNKSTDRQTLFHYRGRQRAKQSNSIRGKKSGMCWQLGLNWQEAGGIPLSDSFMAVSWTSKYTLHILLWVK